MDLQIGDRLTDAQLQSGYEPCPNYGRVMPVVSAFEMLPTTVVSAV
jgi:hypothetical protein